MSSRNAFNNDVHKNITKLGCSFFLALVSFIPINVLLFTIFYNYDYRSSNYAFLITVASLYYLAGMDTTDSAEQSGIGLQDTGLEGMDSFIRGGENSGGQYLLLRFRELLCNFQLSQLKQQADPQNQERGGSAEDTGAA